MCVGSLALQSSSTTSEFGFNGWTFNVCLQSVEPNIEECMGCLKTAGATDAFCEFVTAQCQ